VHVQIVAFPLLVYDSTRYYENLVQNRAIAKCGCFGICHVDRWKSRVNRRDNARILYVEMLRPQRSTAEHHDQRRSAYAVLESPGTAPNCCHECR
jgi:hypothetical protein